VPGHRYRAGRLAPHTRPPAALSLEGAPGGLSAFRTRRRPAGHSARGFGAFNAFTTTPAALPGPRLPRSGPGGEGRPGRPDLTASVASSRPRRPTSTGPAAVHPPRSVKEMDACAHPPPAPDQPAPPSPPRHVKARAARRPGTPAPRRSTGWEPGPVPEPGSLLDWRDGRHYRWDAPCTLCGTATPLRSHAGEAVHKTCAEAWIAAHPTESRLGRFTSDPRPKRGDDDHA
jgi:hypothetical protein